MTVRRNLNASLDPAGTIFHKVSRPTRMTTANQITHTQFRVRVQTDPRPRIAPTFFIFVRPCVLRFRSDERPNLITLQTANAQVIDPFIVELLASRTGLNDQLRNSVQRNVSHSSTSAKAVTFYEHPQKLGALF